jgi:hypothetical protein
MMRRFRIWKACMRARWSMRKGVLVWCPACYQSYGRTHRPCYAAYCGCPCSYSMAGASPSR